MDTENNRFVSYYGYSIALKPGWKKIERMSFADSSRKREVFSPLSDQEIDDIRKATVEVLDGFGYRTIDKGGVEDN